MSSSWLSAKKIEEQFSRTENVDLMASHYWLSQFWERLVFGPEYVAPDSVCDIIVPNEHGIQVVSQCAEATKGRISDITLALYGHFFHNELLIDCLRSDVIQATKLLNDELLSDRVRLPFISGRELTDRFSQQTDLSELDTLPHRDSWKLLEKMPVGVFQHGVFVSGPLGIIKSVEHRWLPVNSSVDCYFRRGAKTYQRQIAFLPARNGVVEAYSWIEQHLATIADRPSEWGKVLTWRSSRQCTERRSDYADIPLVLADCLVKPELGVLFESILKTPAGDTVRGALSTAGAMKGVMTLPPEEITKRIDDTKKLQLLLAIQTKDIVSALDRLVASRHISIPTAELRNSRRRAPSRNLCFYSELSSLGIRPAHPEPFAGLCSAILRAYSETGIVNELAWRLGSDPLRGLQVTLTDFVRREGPEQAVLKLILASQPVTVSICNDLGIDMSEIVPRTERTVARILWKCGFEIPRHDEVLNRLNRRIEQFEEILSGVDFSAGEVAREKVRAEGVNLFVSVEEFLDSIVSFNVWLLSSDHWGASRFEYRVSEARGAVARVLGETLESQDGSVRWKSNGENPLGTQLAYLNAFDRWIDHLGNPEQHARSEVDADREIDEFNRPFPFNHTQFWADSEAGEFGRYKEIFRKVLREIAQADVAGVRNGLDHNRDPARFPTEDQLLLCVTRLKKGVRLSEQHRIYPVTYWFDAGISRLFGSTEYTFKNSRGDQFTVCRPATVSALPAITKVHPVVFAPVNFLGAADSLVFFRVMGESGFSQYWANFPPIATTVKIQQTTPMELTDERESVSHRAS